VVIRLEDFGGNIMPAEPYFVLRIATQDPDIKTPSNPKIIPELTTADV